MLPPLGMQASPISPMMRRVAKAARRRGMAVGMPEKLLQVSATVQESDTADGIL
jgi:hypothetical protein